VKTNKAIEQFIESEIIVDANGREEELMSWYYFFENRIIFPFKAKCMIKRETSPLEVDDVVEVLSLAAEKNCRHEILVRIHWSGKKFAVPLTQLKGTGVSADIKQAINAWHYWADREYEF
jgi:hypothetical protein